MSFIYHFDMCQGKNGTNALIVAEVQNLQMIQEAVIYAIDLSGIANEPNGMREIHMNNKYFVPTLFVFL